MDTGPKKNVNIRCMTRVSAKKERKNLNNILK